MINPLLSDKYIVDCIFLLRVSFAYRWLYKCSATKGAIVCLQDLSNFIFPQVYAKKYSDAININVNN